jgi:hypothetical protein
LILKMISSIPATHLLFTATALLSIL